jgi:hypothetical protein
MPDRNIIEDADIIQKWCPLEDYMKTSWPPGT